VKPDFQREAERKNEVERQKIAAEAELNALRMRHETDLIASEQALHEVRTVMETKKHQDEAALGVIDDELKRRQIETANGENPILALVKGLPGLAASLKVHKLNVREDTVVALGRALMTATGKGERHE